MSAITHVFFSFFFFHFTLIFIIFIIIVIISWQWKLSRKHCTNTALAHVRYTLLTKHARRRIHNFLRPANVYSAYTNFKTKKKTIKHISGARVYVHFHVCFATRENTLSEVQIRSTTMAIRSYTELNSPCFCIVDFSELLARIFVRAEEIVGSFFFFFCIYHPERFCIIILVFVSVSCRATTVGVWCILQRAKSKWKLVKTGNFRRRVRGATIK